MSESRNALQAALRCQDCGCVIRELSAAEVTRVATRPENFIVYCLDCEGQE